MPASLNKALIAGNLTRKPGIEYLNGGSAVCKFVVAVNERYRNKDGEQKESVDYFKIVVWGKNGENCAEHLNQGSSVLVIGKIKNRSFEDENGSKKHYTEIVADEVQFLSSRKTQNNN